MTTLDVSVIIVNYNTLKMTSECIDSVIAKTSGVDYEIILVDNGSKDGSKEFFEKDNRIKYIYSDENLGFGRANNLGYKYAKGKYIFLLNSDTLLIENSIKILYKFLLNFPKAGIVGGQLINKSGNQIHSFSNLYPSILWELNILLSQFIENCVRLCKRRKLRNQGYYDVAYITGADMMIRRSVIEKYGLFDDSFFMYFEETEMSHRYNINGIKSYYYPATKIIHLVNASFKTSELKELLFLKGRKNYYRITLTKWETAIADFIYVTSCILRLLVFIFNKLKFEVYKTKILAFYHVNIQRNSSR